MARVYIGTYGKYNAGSLAGGWVDLDSCASYREFLAACKKLHRDEAEPEYMIQDYEGFPDGLSCMEWITEQEFNDILTNRWGYLAVGILAPIGEEMVFRGAILRILLTANTQQPAPDSRQPSPIIPIAISAAIFALIHLNPAQMPHAFLVGMLLGWIYWRTGSILPTILFHWVNNSTAYVVYNLLPQSQDMKLIDLFGSERAVILSVVFSLLILLPAIYQLHLRMRRV